ncbi:hypothetical protein CCB80_13525 [Armatimonadetes bacterium Uphvl-Ar1]|nr:hypothetical protein CCB80_13525 [Armatimonadetes bacterium Uphvl-Ar1]
MYERLWQYEEVMFAAILAVVSANQADPVNRLASFLDSSQSRGIEYTANFRGTSVKSRWSYTLPNTQLLEVSSPSRTRFFQKGDRIFVAQDAAKEYYEYAGFDFMVSPPEEADLGFATYPQALLSWLSPEGRKGIAFQKTETVNGVKLDWLKQTVETMNGPLDIFGAIDQTGQPREMRIGTMQNPELSYVFEKFGWPHFDLSNWKYQPPIGYVPGNSPKIFRPPTAGAEIELGKWGAVNTKSLNSKGLAIVVTTAEGRPDAELISAWPKVESALKKFGVKTLEIHLDAKDLPKRTWKIVGDGSYLRQLDPPVTPYVYFVNKENIYIGGWAGYAPDQEKKLIGRAVEAFTSDSENSD